MIVTSVQIKTAKTQKHLYCLVFTRSAVVHDTMGYRTFYFSVEEVLISSVFPSMGVQKSLMLGFSYFTEGALLIFALHPLMRKIK